MIDQILLTIHSISSGIAKATGKKLTKIEPKNKDITVVSIKSNKKDLYMVVVFSTIVSFAIGMILLFLIRR